MKHKYKQNFIQAGVIAREVRAYGASLIKKGASYFTVISQICKKIADLKAFPAFPPQIALNNVAAHFLPEPGQDIIFNDEVIKLDIGVCWEGAIGDCAVTIDLSGKYTSLIEASEKALLAAERMVRVGLPLREIGKVIEETITSCGFQPIRNLAGHGLGEYKVHMPPRVPNYDDTSLTGIIKPGMTFAIEPFATTGKGMIYEEGNSTIFSLVASRPLRSPEAREVLTVIRKYQNLPFSIHNLLSDGLSHEIIQKGVEEMKKVGMIHGYPPLLEVSGGFVSQAENSVLVGEKGEVFITTR